MGYSTHSEGFPWKTGVPPIWKEKVPLRSISKIGKEEKYLRVKCKSREKNWLFRMEVDRLTAKWISLIYLLWKSFAREREEESEVLRLFVSEESGL